MRGGNGESSFPFQRKTAETICNALTTNTFLTFFQKSQFGPSIILSILQWNVQAFRAIFSDLKSIILDRAKTSRPCLSACSSSPSFPRNNPAPVQNLLLLLSPQQYGGWRDDSIHFAAVNFRFPVQKIKVRLNLPNDVFFYSLPCLFSSMLNTNGCSRLNKSNIIIT